MGKIVVTEFMTLDGVVQDPHLWQFPYWTEATGAFKTEELMAAGAHLLGRVTYAAFAAAWPNMPEEDVTGRMNGLPHYVVSTTLQTAEWHNSTIIRTNVPAAIAQLKQTVDGDLLVAGSMTLIRTLMEHHLVDQYNLLVYPVVRGAGQRLFGEGQTAALTLLDSRDMGAGVVLLRYAPAPAPAA